jgi:hypothetical protein
MCCTFVLPDKNPTMSTYNVGGWNREFNSRWYLCPQDIGKGQNCIIVCIALWKDRIYQVISNDGFWSLISTSQASHHMSCPWELQFHISHKERYVFCGRWVKVATTWCQKNYTCKCCCVVINFPLFGPSIPALNPLLQAMNIYWSLNPQPSATGVFVLPLNFGVLKVWDLFHFYSIFFF